MFSTTVTDHWLTAETAPPGEHRVVVDEALPHNRALMVLEPVGLGGILTLSGALAHRLDLVEGATVDGEALSDRLAEAGIELNGADHLFYLPAAEQAALRAVRTGARELTDADASAFAVFGATAPEDDLDEAFVELDHWLVVGTFVDGRLACAASMYPWRDTLLADLGVLTLPEFRGRGLARDTVRAISALALERGFEPQYRCQLDNAASVALAGSAGFARFGTWDVIAAED